MNVNNPALTYTLTDFINMQDQDELTYINFSIVQYHMNIKFSSQNILDYYLNELKALCSKITIADFTEEEKVKYKYSPDLLAYDIYGSTQLDFIILLCNGIIDPKEFDLKRKYLLLPKSSILKEFLSAVYNSEIEWINLNRKETQQIS